MGVFTLLRSMVKKLRLEGILIVKRKKHLMWYLILIHLLLLLAHLLLSPLPPIRPHFSNLTNYASNAYPTYYVPNSICPYHASNRQCSDSFPHRQSTYFLPYWFPSYHSTYYCV